MKKDVSIVLPIVTAMILGSIPDAAKAAGVSPDANVAISLCPSLGSTGLMLGEERARQSGIPIERASELPPRFAPFKFTDAEFTPWSGRLAAVTYLGESNGEDHGSWAASIEKGLKAAGWAHSTREGVASAIGSDPKLFEKTLETRNGRRTMIIEIHTSGVLALRCGDAELIQLSRQESDGELAPESPRPEPVPDRPVIALPTAADCSKPEILAAFNTPGHVDETQPQIGRFTAGGAQINDQKRFQQRLHTWLRWKLARSGSVSQERLWEVEDAAEPTVTEKESLSDIQELLAAGAKIGETQDPPGFCKSVVALIHSLANQDRREIGRLVAINKALELEARRVGVVVSK